MKVKNKLTSWEWDALVSKCNLADGHAHQEQNNKQKKIIKNLSKIYFSSEKENQSEIQRNFEEAFFNLGGQKSYKSLPPPLYHYGCSLAIEVAANYLRLNKKSATLLHPSFDNLADVLKRNKVSLSPITEEELIKLSSGNYDIKTDALFLVCPNNPTGFELTESQFINIVKYCKKNKKILILDFSFRFFSSLIKWDQYKILNKSGIDFMVLEDTGKTWPTLDMKLGILLSSKSLYPVLEDVTNDFLLNVSPFIFKLLTSYIKLEKQNSPLSVHRVIETNKNELIEIFKDSLLTVMSKNSSLSVAWIMLPKGWKSTLFCKWLENKNIYILPGVPFYWNDRSIGESFVRIALARPNIFFRKVALKLKKASIKYSKTTR